MLASIDNTVIVKHSSKAKQCLNWIVPNLFQNKVYPKQITKIPGKFFIILNYGIEWKANSI